MIGVTVDHHGFDSAILRYLVGLQETTRAGLVDAGHAAVNSARETIDRTTTRRTGALEDSWHTGWADPTTRIVTNFAKHARFIDSGTGPHVIRARNVKFLRFQMGGQTVFRRFVNHPGTRPRPFIALAMASGQMALRAALTQGVSGLAHQF